MLTSGRQPAKREREERIKQRGGHHRLTSMPEPHRDHHGQDRRHDAAGAVDAPHPGAQRDPSDGRPVACRSESSNPRANASGATKKRRRSGCGQAAASRPWQSTTRCSSTRLDNEPRQRCQWAATGSPVPIQVDPLRGEAAEAGRQNHQEQDDRERIRRMAQVHREALQERDLDRA